MNGHDIFQQILETADTDRDMQRGFFRLLVSSEISRILELNGINKTMLSKRLKKNKTYVSRLLDGEKNLTLDSISDIFFAIGQKPGINFSTKNHT